MPVTTFLSEEDQNHVVEDEDIRFLLQLVRDKTPKKEMHVVKRPDLYKKRTLLEWLIRKPKEKEPDFYDMYTYVGGVGPYQCLLAGTGNKKVVMAYLYGMVNGLEYSD